MASSKASGQLKQPEIKQKFSSGGGLPGVPKTVSQGCLLHRSNAQTILPAAEEDAHPTAAWSRARLAGVIPPADRFNISSRADFAMRGFAISFLTLALVASPDSFLASLFFIEHP